MAETGFLPVMYASYDWNAGKVCSFLSVDGRDWKRVMCPRK